MEHLETICIFLVTLLLASNIWLIVRVLRLIRRLSMQAINLAHGDLMSLQRPCGGAPEFDALRLN